MKSHGKGHASLCFAMADSIGAPLRSLTAGVIAAVLALASCSNQLPLTSEPLATSKRDKAFVQIVGEEVSLNSGLVLRPGTPPVLVIGDPLPANEFIFAVENVTGETIVFPETLFHRRVYEYQETSDEWIEYPLAGYGLPMETSLNSPVQGFSQAEDNIILLGPRDFAAAPRGLVRVYISGRGLDSGQAYGAFADVEFR